MRTYGIEFLLWTGSYTKENVDLITHAKSLGFDGVEIHLGNPDTIPIEETKQALKDYDMKVSFAVTLSDETNSISPDESVRKNAVVFFKKCIDTAHTIAQRECTIAGVTYGAWGYFTGKAEYDSFQIILKGDKYHLFF